MPKPRYKRPVLLACLLLLCVLLVPVVLKWPACRQARLDHALITHIKANNAEAVIADLRQGANANAVETVGAVPSFRQMLGAFFQHRIPKPGRVNTAFAVAFLVIQTELKRETVGTPPPARSMRLLQILLDYGANPNIQIPDGWTPLGYAACYGYTEVVKMLLSKGAHVNLPNDQGGTPLMYACGFECREEPIEHSKIVRLLLQAGAAPNSRNNVKRTPLHDAAYYASSMILKMLLDAHADINVKGYVGETPLSAAVVSNNVENVDILLEQNADPNLRDEGGESPLIYAVQERNLPIIRLLLAQHADPNMPDRRETPLQIAHSMNRNDIIRILRQAGAKQ